MKPTDVIEFFKTQAEAARAVGCAKSSVNEWIENGLVPEGRQYQIQIISNGELKAAMPADRRTNRPRKNNISRIQKKNNRCVPTKA